MLKNLITTYLPKGEKGQDAAEYALLLALIALVIIIAVTAVGLDISQVFADIAAALP